MTRSLQAGMRVAAQIRSHLTIRAVLGVVVVVPVVVLSLIGLEALARARLDPQMFEAPTQFYARPIVFYPGMDLDAERVEAHLQRLGYRRARTSRVAVGEYYRSRREWIIGRRAFRRYDNLDPGGTTRIRLGWRGAVSSVEDAQGRRLRYVGLEPELIGSVHGSTGEERVPVPLADIPQHLIDAVLAIEDQRFYEHHGLDLKRIAGATVANVRAADVVQGGSTLTQQLAKNLFLSNKRSPIRKLRDMAMARALERRYTKEEILEAYLNEVYFGHHDGLAIRGVGRAAQVFFGKDVSQVDLDEAALLAGIIRGPNLYSPTRNPERATERRNLVLDVMLDQKVITAEAHATARQAPLQAREAAQRTRSGRYFVDLVFQQLVATHGRQAVQRGMSVFTTLDMDLQRKAEEAVAKGLGRLERDYPYIAGQDAPLQAALVALDPRTGEILALVGGRDYGSSQFNRAVNARRQPGSSFKPVVALAALAGREGGHTLATMLQDEPFSVETPAGLWEPSNYDGKFHGEVTIREALERSLNVPFARLGMEVGPERIAATGRKLGLESRLKPVPSLALGASEVTPLEMARAFGVLAAGGYRSDLHTTLGVLDAEGEVLSRYEIAGKQVYTPAETYLVTSALRGAVERGTGRSLRTWGFRGPVAAKSGTTNDFRDAWFIGYTPSLAVAVWVGYDDGRSTKLSGARAALPIFALFMRAARGPDGEEDFSRPPGVEVVSVNRESGLRAGWGCRGEREVFLRGTAPRESCSRFRMFTSQFRRYTSSRRSRGSTQR
jgi:penicillin-binding protein 1B